MVKRQRGYISAPLSQLFFEQGPQLITDSLEKHEIITNATFRETFAAQTEDYRKTQ
jgi:hypothetical protein